MYIYTQEQDRQIDDLFILKGTVFCPAVKTHKKHKVQAKSKSIKISNE